MMEAAPATISAVQPRAPLACPLNEIAPPPAAKPNSLMVAMSTNVPIFTGLRIRPPSQKPGRAGEKPENSFTVYLCAKHVNFN